MELLLEESLTFKASTEMNLHFVFVIIIIIIVTVVDIEILPSVSFLFSLSRFLYTGPTLI